ncbi:hypothetical protein [Prevotella pectinovora]|uniref:hypothetical protein n=1 Tax=Prevotella pectinovora TaxID=1602169 RepID=UPI00307AE728
MRKVRIGNDINVRWEVKTDGQAVSLEGKTLKLYVRSAYRKEEITTFTVEGCVVSFTYPASMQRMTGARAVILEDATEGAPRRTVCADQAFILVAHSCEENDDDVEFEDFMVSLQSNVLIGKPGLSAYEVWLSEGNTGTLEDWYAFLRKPATDIASDVAAAEAERTTAETARDKAEQARQGDENLRKTAEENRASAETGRSDAEQRRDANETSRESAEQMRKSAEADRIRDEKEREEAETSRKAAEKFRDTAENDRNDAEQERRQHEDARADAEGKRDTAETLRKQAETGRDNAEQERTTAEQTRKDSETSRVAAERERTASEQTRQENETTRVSAETERGKKETERIASETERKSSEQERKSAEQERKTAETGREEAETKRKEAETKREEAIVKFENDFNEKLSLKADLEEFNNTVSDINTNIATKANAQDVTNAIGELQDKIGDRVVVSGNVTNNPDEEDITAEGDTPQTQVLKLKDRAYDSLNASGKGYKILRKNWQPINGERKNVLTQAMINEPNTIYEIRYDFDLNGKEITLPEYCDLRFNGGSFNNGNCNFKSLGHIVVKAKEFGFRKGTDSTASNHNGVLFQSLISSGIGIDFENEEYNLNFIKKSSFEYLYIINGILNISSSVSELFIPAQSRNGHIEIRNTTFNLKGGEENVFISNSSASLDNYYTTFIIKKCRFNKINLFRIIFSDYNPSIHKCGATHVIIEDNTINDSVSNFLVLSNMFYENCVIRNNFIKNNTYSIFYFGIDNAYVNFHNKENGTLLFENNIHINDDDFLCEANNQSYTCTLLSEGNVVIMKNNIFQNIRAFNSVVYPFYISSNYFECTNNIIKNVFNFNECSHPIINITFDNALNEIFKSKSSTNSIENPGVRIIKGNTVQIERENYISAMKMSPEFPDDYAHYDDVMLFTKLYSPVDFQNLEFTNNNITIEGVLSCPTSTIPVLNCKFNYNHLKFWNLNRLSSGKPEEMILQKITVVLMPSYACTYSSVFEFIGNTFECTSSTFCPSMAFTSFTEKSEGDNGYSSYIIKNNTGNNVNLSLIDADGNYKKWGTQISRQIVYENNNSQYLQKSNIYSWKHCVLPSTDSVVMTNCNMVCNYEFYTKKVDCDFNLQPFVYNLAGQSYRLVETRLPTIDSEAECYEVKYIKKNGDYKTMEIFKDGDSLKISSDSTKDKTVQYWDLNDPLFLYFNNAIAQGGLIVRKSSDGLNIQSVVGSQGYFRRLIIKYLPTRLNLHLQKGGTKNRPILETGETGFLFFDTTLNKYIVWNGTEWTNMDGSSLGEQPTQDENR